MLRGLMMDDYPLTLTHLFTRAETLFPQNAIASRMPDGSMHRYTYADYCRRSRQLGAALRSLGVGEGDRVATIAWNSYRHFEIYFGAPIVGSVVHTLNPRLHPNDLAYIAEHAGDTVMFVDRTLLPVWESFKDEVSSVKHVVVMPDDGPAPEGYLDYEQLVEGESPDFELPQLDERAAAAVCYTSGTTGKPKGVVYSHRSTVLHTLVSCMTDALGISEHDVILPVVPLFHANGWGTPFDAVLTGARMVFPGRDLSPEALLDLMAAERVTVAAGVPTIWIGILAALDEQPDRWDLSAMRTMVIGGSAAPAAMIDGFAKRHGLEVTHAWGMTETNPLGTLARLKAHHDDLDDAGKLAVRATQGHAVPFVEIRHADDEGNVLPWDGEQMGELEVRGPWVAASYFRAEGEDEKFTADGWFKTGDVVTINPEGYMTIADRAKDVIKSGGEWISSVELENALMAHPAVLEAAVFAARHERWDERPLAAVVLKPGQQASADELRAHLEPDFARFWLPDDYIFMDEIPRNATGKFMKSDLRERYGDHLVGRQ